MQTVMQTAVQTVMQTAVQERHVTFKEPALARVSGELLVGLGLILSLLTGWAAFFGTFMSMAFLLGGSVGVNPVYFAVGTWLVLAWRTVGWWGLDRWVLPALGTPWEPGSIFRDRTT